MTAVTVVSFVLVVVFRSFRLAVSGFSTCQLVGCNVIWVKFLKRPSIAPTLHGETVAYNVGDMLLLCFIVMCFFLCNI